MEKLETLDPRGDIVVLPPATNTLIAKVPQSRLYNPPQVKVIAQQDTANMVRRDSAIISDEYHASLVVRLKEIEQMNKENCSLYRSLDTCGDCGRRETLRMFYVRQPEGYAQWRGLVLHMMEAHDCMPTAEFEKFLVNYE